MDADKALGLHNGAASSVAIGGRASAGGWHFSFREGAPPPLRTGFQLVAAARSKPIVAFHIATSERREFDSGKAAASELGMSRASISLVLSGKLKSCKGWTFEFVLDKF